MANLPPLKDVIDRYELSARKKLGQHFLLDLNLTKKIVQVAGDLSNVVVFEIGPGPGGLTRAIMDSNAKKLIVVEKDKRCLPALEEIKEAYNDNKMEIIFGDALKENLIELSEKPRAIIANLPYNVGTPMLISWLKQIDEYQSLTLMFQSEVANRISAKNGGKSYGRLSVLAQFCCDVSCPLKIPAKAFTPPPKVDSAIVHLTPRKNRPTDVEISLIEKVTGMAFGQRRKMLRVSLKPLGGEALLVKAGIDPRKRAQELSIKEFEELARLIN